MKYIKIGLLIVFGLVLQSTVLAEITLFTMKPDLLLIIVISLALLKGTTMGLIVGFVAGLLQDILIGRFIGLHAVSKMIVGYLFGLIERKLFKENLILPFFGTMLGTIISELIIWFIGLFLFWNYPFSNALRQVILPVALINAVIAPFIYYRIYKSIG